MAKEISKLEEGLLSVNHVLYKILKESIRTLGLDRMNNVQNTNVHFKMPKDFDAQKYYANTVGVYVNEESPITEVKIRAYGT